MFEFTHLCTVCHRRQLIFPSLLTGARETDRGSDVSFTCWCGAAQTAVVSRCEGREPALV